MEASRKTENKKNSEQHNIVIGYMKNSETNKTSLNSTAAIRGSPEN